MAKKQRKYDMEYKIQAVKLAKELGGAKAAAELGIPENTIYAWTKAAREGRLNVGSGSHTPETAMNLAEEPALLRRQVREQEKEIRRLKEENEFLEEASAFFAASRRKSAKDRDGKLYVSAIFDCFDAAVAGMAMDTNMKAVLCGRTLTNAVRSYPALRGAIIHSDRGSQYTSETYRRAVAKYGILQSMNSAGGRCHDNARCESMWARMKEELIYGRHDTERMTVEELKTLIWRYFISYWNNRRICSSNEGLPPMVKRQRYYESLDTAA